MMLPHLGIGGTLYRCVQPLDEMISKHTQPGMPPEQIEEVMSHLQEGGREYRRKIAGAVHEEDSVAPSTDL